MKYFKIHLGYDKSIPITEKDLPRALMAQITGDLLILDNASILGSSITLIEPNYHRAMGYNEGYKLQAEDWAQIKKECSDYQGYIGRIKENVQLALKTGDKTLLEAKN